MRMLMKIFLILAAFAVPAFAQLDTEPDGIGIYADLEATQVSINAEPGVITPVYLLATNVSQEGGIMSWAAQIVVPPNAEILAWNIDGTAMNFSSPPHFVVARPSDHHPQAPVILLMTFYIQMTDSDPAYFYVQGTEYAGSYPWDSAPVYLAYEDYYTPFFMHCFPNGLEEPVFAVNGDLTPTQATTWSEVKALFQ